MTCVSLAQVIITHLKITVHMHRFHGLDLILHWTMDDLHSWTVSTFLFFSFTSRFSSDTVYLPLFVADSSSPFILYTIHLSNCLYDQSAEFSYWEMTR